MKKIKVKSVRTKKVVPHNYQIHLTFTEKANIAPLLAELVPEQKENIISLASHIALKDPYDMLEPIDFGDKYYIDIIANVESKEFTLIIGYNNKKEMWKILDKYLEVSHPKEK